MVEGKLFSEEERERFASMARADPVFWDELKDRELEPFIIARGERNEPKLPSLAMMAQDLIERVYGRGEAWRYDTAGVMLAIRRHTRTELRLPVVGLSREQVEALVSLAKADEKVWSAFVEYERDAQYELDDYVPHPLYLKLWTAIREFLSNIYGQDEGWKYEPNQLIIGLRRELQKKRKPETQLAKLVELVRENSQAWESIKAHEHELARWEAGQIDEPKMGAVEAIVENMLRAVDHSPLNIPISAFAIALRFYARQELGLPLDGIIKRPS